MFFLLFCILFMYAQERVYALVYTHIRKCVHIYYNVWSIILLTLCGLFVKILLKSKLFLRNTLLFRKIVVLLHSLLRNQAFLKATEERVLWKILHKQTSSTRSGQFLSNKKVDWVKETNRQVIDKSGLLSFNKRKGYSS